MGLALLLSPSWSPESSRDPMTPERRAAQAHARTQERALILRLRDGDADAFAKIVTLHIDRVTRLAQHIVGAADVAEDVAQNVFVQCWEHRQTIDPERPIKPYLLRAARNRALDEEKAATVRVRHQDRVRQEANAGSIRAVVPSHESGVLTLATVQAALAQLPERRRMALHLWLEEEIPPAEVAVVFGISAQAADRLIRRALADIREILLVSKQ